MMAHAKPSTRLADARRVKSELCSCARYRPLSGQGHHRCTPVLALPYLVTADGAKFSIGILKDDEELNLDSANVFLFRPSVDQLVRMTTDTFLQKNIIGVVRIKKQNIAATHANA